jgi:hypothetical protein
MYILTRDYEPEWEQYIYLLTRSSLQKISLSLNQNILSFEIETTCHVIINKRQTLVAAFSSWTCGDLENAFWFYGQRLIFET